MKLVVATFLSPVLEPLYRAVAGHIGRQLGHEIEFVVGASHDQFAAREIDLGFICGRPYVALADGPVPVHPLVAPIVRGERYGGRPIYFSDVVVRADSAIRSFDDLRGSRWCFNDLDSHSGYGVVLHHLSQLGEATGFFGSFEPVGSHTEAMWHIANGRYDAAAIDSHLLDVVHSRSPECLLDLRVIETLGPSTIQPLVAGDHVPAELRDEIRASVLTLDGPILDQYVVERFAAVDNNAYDDIRRMSLSVGT